MSHRILRRATDFGVLASPILVLFSAACSKPSSSEPSKPETTGAAPRGSGESSLGVRSCKHADLCMEWQKLAATELFSARSECTDTEGHFATVPCPRERALASCSHESGGAAVYLYDAPGLDLGQAETECTKTQGTFVRLKAAPDASVPAPGSSPSTSPTTSLTSSPSSTPSARDRGLKAGPNDGGH